MADPIAFVARAREVLAKATPGPLTSGQRSVYGLDHEFVANHANHRDKDLHVLAVNALPALCDVVGAAWKHLDNLKSYADHDEHEYEDCDELGAAIVTDCRLCQTLAEIAALDAALARLEVPRG